MLPIDASDRADSCRHSPIVVSFNNQPSQQGFEAEIGTQVARHREAQLTASVEGVGVTFAEALTNGAQDRANERWVQRTLGQVGEQLAAVAIAYLI